jgi:hypothetical protein
MQGGYSISTKGILIPSDIVNNNFDKEVTKRFHLHLKSILSDIYTKVAIYVTNILASIFNDLRDTKHDIGIDL